MSSYTDVLYPLVYFTNGVFHVKGPISQSSFRKDFHSFCELLTLKLSFRKILSKIAYHKSSLRRLKSLEF